MGRVLEEADGPPSILGVEVAARWPKLPACPKPPRNVRWPQMISPNAVPAVRMPKLYLATACARATSFMPPYRSSGATPMARTLPSPPAIAARSKSSRKTARGRLRILADRAAAIAVKTVAQAARAGFDRIVICCFTESSAALRARAINPEWRLTAPAPPPNPMGPAQPWCRFRSHPCQ